MPAKLKFGDEPCAVIVVQTPDRFGQMTINTYGGYSRKMDIFLKFRIDRPELTNEECWLEAERTVDFMEMKVVQGLPKKGLNHEDE